MKQRIFRKLTLAVFVSSTVSGCTQPPRASNENKEVVRDGIIIRDGTNWGTPTVFPSVVPKQVDVVAEGMESAAAEFRLRLAYYDGELLSFAFDTSSDLEGGTSSDGSIVAVWKSRKCNFVEEEIIDLAISINRGINNYSSGIKIKRTCGSSTQNFTISGSSFSRYRSGQINDSQFLRSMK